MDSLCNGKEARLASRVLKEQIRTPFLPLSVKNSVTCANTAASPPAMIAHSLHHPCPHRVSHPLTSALCAPRVVLASPIHRAQPTRRTTRGRLNTHWFSKELSFRGGHRPCSGPLWSLNIFTETINQHAEKPEGEKWEAEKEGNCGREETRQKVHAVDCC